jgi:hypothetical protein
MFNQDGAKVMEMEGYGMFGRRHPAPAQELAAPAPSRPAEAVVTDKRTGPA